MKKKYGPQVSRPGRDRLWKRFSGIFSRSTSRNANHVSWLRNRKVWSNDSVRHFRTKGWGRGADTYEKEQIYDCVDLVVGNMVDTSIMKGWYYLQGPFLPFQIYSTSSAKVSIWSQTRAVRLAKPMYCCLLLSRSWKGSWLIDIHLFLNWEV